MEANLYTFLHFVRSVYTSMPVGLQACLVYSFTSVIIVALILVISMRWISFLLDTMTLHNHCSYTAISGVL